MLWALLNTNLLTACYHAGWPQGHVPLSELSARLLLAACCSSQASAQDGNGQQYAAMCQMLMCCRHA